MIKTPRGTKDILPEETFKWQYLESKFKEITALFSYKEIRTPIFELVTTKQCLNHCLTTN